MASRIPLACLGTVALLLLLALPAPSLAHELTVGNRVANGGFEALLAGWLLPSGCCTNVALTPPAGPAPCDGARSLVVTNAIGGGFAYQPVTTMNSPVNVNPRPPLLDFSAEVLANASAPGPQAVRVVDGWPTVAVTLVHVTFAGGNVTFGAYGSPDGAVAIPSGAGCHHYQVRIEPSNMTHVEVRLFVDGSHAATVLGDRLFPHRRAGIIQVGDVGIDGLAGASADVQYDGIHFAGLQRV